MSFGRVDIWDTALAQSTHRFVGEISAEVGELHKSIKGLIKNQEALMKEIEKLKQEKKDNE